MRETVYGIVKRLRYFLERIETVRGSLACQASELRVLDVGCGTGINVSLPLAQAGYVVCGIDSHEATIGRARELGSHLDNLSYECRTLADSPPLGGFHVVILSEILEHLEQPEACLRQARLALMDGGLLLVTLPNGYGYFEAEKFVEERLPGLTRLSDRVQYRLVQRFARPELRERRRSEARPEHCRIAWTTLAPDQGHCQRFTPGRLRRLLAAGGFRILDFRNRTFLAGNILANLVRDWDRFLKWNCEVADRMSPRLCSGWLLAAVPAEGGAGDEC